MESREIRGFSENNNLALRQVESEFCFVINDDTSFDVDVIAGLVDSFNKISDSKLAVVSPVTLNGDGTIQRCGKPKYNLFTVVLSQLKLIGIYEKLSSKTNKIGLFQTYNISGACFFIKTNIFRDMGWFDDRYFFCPEDIALSTKLNESGYKCYVNTEIKVTHYGGATRSRIQSATIPAMEKGECLFYGGDSCLKRCIYILSVSIPRMIKFLYWGVIYGISKNNTAKMMLLANRNSIASLFSRKTPKEIFIKYYKNIK